MSAFGPLTEKNPRGDNSVYVKDETYFVRRETLRLIFALKVSENHVCLKLNLEKV